MKQALNPGKLSIVRSTSASPLSAVTSKTSSAGGGHASRLERAEGPLAGSTTTSRDTGRVSSVTGLQSAKVHAGKSGSGVASDQSSLVALKLAVSERRPSNDTIPVNTLKVDNALYGR